MALHRLSSVTIGVPDPEPVATYYDEFGLSRADDLSFSTLDGGRQLLVQQAPTRRLVEMVVGVDDHDDLARVAATLTSAGHHPELQADALRVIEPETHQGETFDLDDELTIGRSPGCGVPTPDDIYASTVHARLFRQKDQLWVEDLGSTNGTYVNSERISQAQRLGKGDVLQAGSTVFEVTR